MRLVFVSCVVLAVLVCACGDSREEPTEKPEPAATAATEEPDGAEPQQTVGLTDEERKRLVKRYAAEANARITAENAESVGKRMLAEIERELAAELAAAGDAGSD
ncbi:MAG: hypothetical protein JRF63_10870 [Deltaproteobacteria bacterium]|nr:hypothetical protein [Deltaproteobacteria bacterium]